MKLPTALPPGSLDAIALYHRHPETDFSCAEPPQTSACTRPTLPLSSITLMPCGCVGLLVRMRATTPSVNAPVRWFCFSTICTRNPERISLRTGTLIRTPSRVFTAFNQNQVACSGQAQAQIDGPAAANVGAGAAQVAKDGIVIAAGFFEGVGKDGEPSGVELAR